MRNCARVSNWACPHTRFNWPFWGSTPVHMLICLAGNYENRALCVMNVTHKHGSDAWGWLELSERQRKTVTGEDICYARKIALRAWENGENSEQCLVVAYIFSQQVPSWAICAGVVFQSAYVSLITELETWCLKNWQKREFLTGIIQVTGH